jgi:hypothetical protein
VATGTAVSIQLKRYRELLASDAKLKKKANACDRQLNELMKREMDEQREKGQQYLFNNG